jgi:hypothetical protein
MTGLKRISMIVLASLLALSAATAFGQTRRRTTTRKGRAATTTQSAAQGTARTAATRVAEQIKSLGKFLYLYGPISKDLASGESGAQGNPSSPAATETMQRNRAKLREVFQSYRAQMDELETLFSSSSELRLYYTRLLGVAASAARAEDAVAAGRYDEGGRALLDVMNRLTDVLLQMQGG